MEHAQLLRVKTLNRKEYGGNIIAVAARHNLRENLNELDNIDPSRTRLNVILRGSGSAADVAAAAVSLMEQAKLKRLYSNAALGLEILFSLRPLSGIAELNFFTDAVAWAEGYFEVPILSAVIHHDEATPHCHIIMLPLFNGRMIGNALLGNPQKLKAMHTDFHVKVGQGYGLKQSKPAKRHSAAARAKAAGSIIDELKGTLKGIDEPTFWDAMRDTITEAPAALMAWYGIEYEIPTQPKKTFASIMTKNCPEQKHKRAIVVPLKNAIAVPVSVSTPQVKPLSCVVVADSPPLASSVDAPIQDEFVREREEDHAADYWDEERGEFIKPPTKQKMKSAEIDRVRGVIAAMQR